MKIPSTEDNMLLVSTSSTWHTELEEVHIREPLGPPTNQQYHSIEGKMTCTNSMQTEQML